uniref:Uncharacterized protein n=1 Tax=Arundo donax TaxID=35708 RepID=A0A0A9BTY7_ARUDO
MMFELSSSSLNQLSASRLWRRPRSMILVHNAAPNKVNCCCKSCVQTT